MKRRTITSATVLLVLTSYAQQPKAYETVRYTARLHDTVFVLSYADGYAPASRAWMQAHGKTIRFAPVAGVPTAAGEWLFLPTGPSKHATLALQQLAPDDPAPARIQAVYRAASLRQAILFMRQ